MTQVAPVLFERFVQYREDMGEPMSDKAKARLSTQLGRYEPMMQGLLIKQAMANGWKGIFRDFDVNKDVMPVHNPAKDMRRKKQDEPEVEVHPPFI